MITACNGTYYRDGGGTWRYAHDDTAVPAAVDLTISTLYNLPVALRGGGNYVEVPLRLVQTEPELAWAKTHARGIVDDEHPILVPAAVWDQRSVEPLGMWAPELHPERLLTIDDVAHLAGVDYRSIQTYIARGSVPMPPLRVGTTPAWPRPVIEHWLATRRRRGRPPGP